MQFNVGDLLLKEKPQQTFQGIIVKFNDKLSYPYYIEWINVSSGHYKEYEIIDFIKNKSITYFPIVK
jgi:hypothetical protein